MALNLSALVDPAHLRRAGWTVPARIGSPFRVYDNRLSLKFHRRVLAKLGIGEADQVKVVGGDFLTASAMEEDLVTDSEALQNGTKWWTNDGHVWVNPSRQGLRAWVEEICCQMDPTGAKTITLALFADRSKVSTDVNITEIIPPLEPLFHIEDTTTTVHAVGERVPLRRIPRQSKELPPSVWDEGFSLDKHVLLVVHIKRGVGESNPHVVWLDERVPPPLPPQSQVGCETLFGELLLPPGIRPDRASGFFQTTLRRAARENSLEVPLGDGRPHADGRLVWGTFGLCLGSS